MESEEQNNIIKHKLDQQITKPIRYQTFSVIIRLPNLDYINPNITLLVQLDIETRNAVYTKCALHFEHHLYNLMYAHHLNCTKLVHKCSAHLVVRTT